MSRRVGIITYWYPPNRTIGALRLAKFAKYLPCFGWEPTVITIRPASGMYLRAGELPDERSAGDVYRTGDGSLHALVTRIRPSLVTAAGAAGSGAGHSRGSRFNRAAYAVYRNLLCFPDECWPWLFSLPSIARAVERAAPHALLSSSPPATTHLIASRLARRFGIPWVADYRDPWSASHTLPRPFPLNRLERRLERRVVRHAAALTAVSEPIRAQLEALHAKPAFVVMNGMDEEHLVSSPADTPAGAPFTLVHTGLLYPGTRDPRIIFAAVRDLLADGTVRAGDLVVRFLGRNLDIASRALQEFPEVAPLVELAGEVSYEESLRQQRSASALLLLEWPDPRAKGVLTGKLFEYLGAGRPVLAVAPRDGEIARVLADTSGGRVVTNPAEAAGLLRGWLQASRAGGTEAPAPDRAKLARYTRREQTRALAEVLHRISRT